MVFWCLPPTNKCEWSELRGFVDHYNATYGTSYTRKSCLDMEIRDRKAPELLLESHGEIPIVIERKSVAWPPDYLSSHSKEHHLSQYVPRALGGAFRDRAYELTVRGDYLKEKSKSDVTHIADQIIREVLSNTTRAKTRRGVGGEAPIPWRFRQLGPEDLDASESPTGVLISITEPTVFDHPSEMPEEDSNEAKVGYTRAFERAAKAAAAKFDEYPDCLKLLLVQFHGDDSSLEGEGIIPTIKSVQLPDMVDQVWLAEHDWVGEDELEVVWNRVR